MKRKRAKHRRLVTSTTILSPLSGGSEKLNKVVETTMRHGHTRNMRYDNPFLDILIVNVTSSYGMSP